MHCAASSAAPTLIHNLYSILCVVEWLRCCAAKRTIYIMYAAIGVDATTYILYVIIIIYTHAPSANNQQPARCPKAALWPRVAHMDYIFIYSCAHTIATNMNMQHTQTMANDCIDSDLRWRNGAFLVFVVLHSTKV